MYTKKIAFLFLAILILAISLSFSSQVYAATTPNLGQASSFGILSSSYTNTVGGTTINGDLGYTTGPATAATVNGTIYSPPSTKYSSAGTDQGAALGVLNSLPCTFNFASITDLSLLSQPLAPGVYCITAATLIGTGGITLSGSGTYLFRINGALTTSANSIVTLAGGASPCDVFWTPTQATTIGANSTFVGTDIDDAGITIGSTVNWIGRALAFGSTVSTTTDTISVPNCAVSPTAVPSSSSSSSTNNGSTSSSSPAACITIAPELNTMPIISESKKVSPTSIFISWNSFSNVNTFNVRYGLTNGDWLYNTDVTGLSTTINDLPPNQPIWIQVANRNTCSIAVYGDAQFVGAPRLPNTGMSSYVKNNTVWDNRIFLIFSTFFK